MSTKIEIISGEGENGTREEYDGEVTVSAILERLEEERCNGDRWARVEIDGERVEDDDLEHVLRVS